MSYHQDWLMRQIEAISAMLSYLLTGKKKQAATIEEKQQTISDSNRLYQKLSILVAAGEIGEAENLLFAAMEESDPEVPEAGVQFYRDINALSDAQLAAHDFSREEIFDGLKMLCGHYGLDFF